MIAKIIRKILMVFSVSVFAGVGLLADGAFAGSNTMTVSPPTQRIILIPGQTYTGAISVFNASGSEKPLDYAVEIGSFSQHRSEGENSVDDYESTDHISVSSYNQIMNWIKLDKTKGTLAPGEVSEISYRIEVPEDAPSGGQYATILVVDDTASGPIDNSNVVINQKFQFASVLYAEVTGDSRQIGTISDNSIPSFLLNGSLEATSMVKNEGNVHTDAEYTLQVWPLFSAEEICTNEENPETSLILPETERYHAQSCDLPSVGIFKAKQVVKIFGETSIVERTVVVCPLWLLFLILFVIIAIVIWIVTKVRGNKKRSQSRSND